MVATLASQPEFADIEGCASFQRRSDRDQRALSSQTLIRCLRVARRRFSFSAKIVTGKISSQSMTEFISSRLTILRDAVIIAALFTLCVSSNVGPRFLPLPALE